jgi:hypothetical protein
MVEHASHPVFARVYARVAGIAERRGGTEHRRKLRFYEHVISESVWEARFQRLADATLWPPPCRRLSFGARHPSWYRAGRVSDPDARAVPVQPRAVASIRPAYSRRGTSYLMTQD